MKLLKRYWLPTISGGPSHSIYAYLNKGLLNVVYFGDSVVRKR